MKSLCLIIALLLTLTAFGQSDCPCFKITQGNVGCAPFNFDVENCSDQPVTYKFGASEFTSTTNYTFSVVGEYQVIQQGNFYCGGIIGYKSDSVLVSVKSTPAPSIQAFSCAKNKAYVVANDPQYDEYRISDASSTVIERNFSKVITLGNAPLQVTGNYLGANCGGTGPLNVLGNVVLPDVKISTLTSSNNSFEINYNGVSSEMYEVYVKAGSNDFVLTDTIKSGTSSYAVNNLTQDIQYCVKLRSIDFCGQTGSFSNELCTIKLSGTAVAEKNQISWEPILNAISYRVMVNNTQIPGSLQGIQTNSFTDTNIICGNNYCYQLIAEDNNQAFSLSDSVCLVAISTKKPLPVEDLSSTIHQNKVQLEWITTTTGNTYQIQGFENNEFKFLANTQASPFTDANSEPSKQKYCYRISYSDICQNRSDFSAITCPILLYGTVEDALTRNLTWSSYVGWTDGVKEYHLEKVDESGTVYSSLNLGLVNNRNEKGLDTIQQVIIYRIKAVSPSGKISYSNTWKAVQKSNFSMPNAFTPNGDGLNDFYHAEGLFITEFSLDIWNRFGEGVFNTKSFQQGWDGKINGQDAPSDTYLYKVEAKDKEGISYKRNGSLKLIK